MQSKATTVAQYLAELPADRRAAIQAVRQVILDNLPAGYEEGIMYGMIGYFVPHRLYPPGYHCDPRLPLGYASLASQKNYMSLYLFCAYCDQADGRWFREAWLKSGKKLDMGKSCVRFKSLDDVPLAVVGQAIKRMPVKKFIAFYESALQENMRRRGTGAAAKGAAAAKPTPTKDRTVGRAKPGKKAAAARAMAAARNR